MEHKRRIGVYVCYCGGNISDYVDVEAVVKGVTDEQGVVVCRTHMFTCSDAAQQEIIDDITDQKLDGLVVASCSPQLHMYTFRGMAERAGLNPYQYVQVNLREQDSWAHTDNKQAATAKGINMVRSGIAKCGLTRPLTPLRVETKPRTLVIGAGVSGMRAAINLADMGLSVYLIEKEETVGGWALEVGRIAPEGHMGTEVIEKLLKDIQQHDNIILYTGTELISKSGNIGDFMVKVLIKGKEEIELNVGAILVTTGFDPYTPKEGEYGWGTDGVVDLKEFRQMLADGKLEYKGKKLQNIVFVYCVG
ncbi:MAG: CoB--CoM heterodisulfide reductase iron-sulfur subunit A family protein, partial [Spirochaetales bacterium]|nr:CoB--CoM heterodisulfide reductase iron-sulfur subunit A family protein [Spirochaetales bacterium]